MKGVVIFTILPILSFLPGAILESVSGNWCNKTIMIDQVMTLEVHKPVQTQKDTWWCWLINYQLDCTNYTIEFQNVSEVYQTPSVIQECCPGYQQDGDKCLPICSKGCENGICREPEICECNEGYGKVANGTDCRPLCKDCSALWSHCVAPNKCVCRPGYAAEVDPINSGLFCRPICDPPCANGTCAGPHCDCEPYDVRIIDEMGTFSWLGKCAKCDCLNGACKLDECVCHEGYVKSGPRSCTLECPGDCEEGCSSPGVCLTSSATTIIEDPLVDGDRPFTTPIWGEDESEILDNDELIDSSSSSESLDSSSDLVQETSTVEAEETLEDTREWETDRSWLFILGFKGFLLLILICLRCYKMINTP